MGDSPWGLKESDTTKATEPLSTHAIQEINRSGCL